MPIRELISAGKIELLESLYEACQEMADEWEERPVREDEAYFDLGYPEPLVVLYANQCEAARSEYAATRRYLDADKPPAVLGRADGLPRA
jgi:hypothetical protein